MNLRATRVELHVTATTKLRVEPVAGWFPPWRAGAVKVIVGDEKPIYMRKADTLDLTMSVDRDLTGEALGL